MRFIANDILTAMNRRSRILSGIHGVAVVAIAMWLGGHGLKVQAQVIVLTAFALDFVDVVSG